MRRGGRGSPLGEQFFQSVSIIRHHFEGRVDGGGSRQVYACFFENVEGIVGCARFEEAEVVFDGVGFVVEDALGEGGGARYPCGIRVDVVVAEQVAEA